MRKQSKLEKTIVAFLDAGPKGLRSVEVATPFHGYQLKHFPDKFWSSCLNSDVSELGKLGIVIDRRVDPYVSEDGTQTRFKRYWLKDRSAACQAIRLLAQYRKRRKASPIPKDLAQRLVNQFPAQVPLRLVFRHPAR